jgi:hypothetical protein
MADLAPESVGQRLKRKFRRFVRWVVILTFLAGIGVFSFLYWGTFSTGVRAGIVIKVSEKGFLFKTYEGQLNSETFGANKTGSPIIEVFDFSVSDKDVYEELTKVSLSGERVNLHYTERYTRFFWRGDTKYFVTRVERRGQ